MISVRQPSRDATDCRSAHPADTTASVRRQPGFTLIELLLALTVIVIAAGGLWPGISRALTHSRLKEAADGVQVLLERGRILAIERTEPFQFRFEPDGQAAVLLPAEITSPSASTANNLPRMLYLLPEGLHFAVIEGDSGSESLMQMTEQLPPELLSGLPESDRLAGIDWSLPIVFTPGGTAVDCRLQIVDETGSAIGITLRGLTAVSRVSHVTEGADQ